MSDKQKISDAEWKVLDVVWDDPPATAQAVISELAQREGWKPATIKTLLSRLVKKQVLEPEQQGSRYLYHPRITRERAVAYEADSFLSKICKGSLVPMLHHFANSDRPLDAEELAALRQLLDGGDRDTD